MRNNGTQVVVFVGKDIYLNKDLVVEDNVSETGAYVMLLGNRQYLLRLFKDRTTKSIKEQKDKTFETSLGLINKGHDAHKLTVDSSMLNACKRRRANPATAAPKGASASSGRATGCVLARVFKPSNVS